VLKTDNVVNLQLYTRCIQRLHVGFNSFIRHVCISSSYMYSVVALLVFNFHIIYYVL